MGKTMCVVQSSEFNARVTEVSDRLWSFCHRDADP